MYEPGRQLRPVLGAEAKGWGLCTHALTVGRVGHIHCSDWCLDSSEVQRDEHAERVDLGHDRTTTSVDLDNAQIIKY